MLKCSKCKSAMLDNQFFCPNCHTLNKREVKDVAIDKKRYDLLLEKYSNEYLDGNKDRIYDILTLFANYRIDQSNVFDNYLFDINNEIEFYKLAPKDERCKELFARFYDFFLPEYEKNIKAINSGINEKEIQLARFIDNSSEQKDRNLNWLTLTSIGLLLIGLVFGFLVKNNVLNYIGYGFAGLGAIATIIVAALSPKYDYKHQVDKITFLLEEAKNNKKGLEEQKAAMDDIKNGFNR